MEKQPVIQFNKTDYNDFFKVLNQRVNTYFKNNNLKKTGNWRLYLKSLIMTFLFVVPYILFMTVVMPWWINVLLVIIMGIGMTGVGMNVMHDANHGSYSSRKIWNKILGSSIFILAGNVYNWQVQHNVLHHTYTNIEGFDEDIDAGKIIRFNKHSPWKWYHRYQHIYFIFFYGLMTFNWALISDYMRTKSYLSRKLAYGKYPNPLTQWSVLIGTKLLYFTIWIVLPILFSPLAWWEVLIGFFIMHYTAGLLLSVIFQLAHVVECSDMPSLPEDGQLKYSWAVHQLFTTANFSTHSRFLSWFTGGLNFQMEHHVFPNICHIHYRKISEILRETTIEFNLPYLEYKTIGKAIKSHYNHLKQMGKRPISAI